MIYHTIDHTIILSSLHQSAFPRHLKAYLKLLPHLPAANKLRKVCHRVSIYFPYIKMTLVEVLLKYFTTYQRGTFMNVPWSWREILPSVFDLSQHIIVSARRHPKGDYFKSGLCDIFVMLKYCRVCFFLIKFINLHLQNPWSLQMAYLLLYMHAEDTCKTDTKWIIKGTRRDDIFLFMIYPCHLSMSSYHHAWL